MTLDHNYRLLKCLARVRQPFNKYSNSMALQQEYIAISIQVGLSVFSAHITKRNSAVAKDSIPKTVSVKNHSTAYWFLTVNHFQPFTSIPLVLVQQFEIKRFFTFSHNSESILPASLCVSALIFWRLMGTAVVSNSLPYYFLCALTLFLHYLIVFLALNIVAKYFYNAVQA